MKIPLLIGFAGVAAALFAGQADSLLDGHTKALQGATSLEAGFTVQNLPGGPVEYTLKLAKPGKFKLETPEEIVVANGTTVWTYKKAANTYTEVPQEAGDVKKFLKKDAVLPWTAFFDKTPFKEASGVKVGATRVIKGKTVTEVSVTLPGKPDRTATLFIDKELGIARGVSILTAPDKQTIIVAKELSVAKDSTKESDFEFSAPAGSKKVEPAAASGMGFDKVASIFQSNCGGCHNASRPRAGLDLTSYAGTMAGGRGGKDVVAGDPDGSPLMSYLKGNGKPVMPPNGALSDSDIATISAWIKAGATEK
jgi:outer membrane lipoprotein-sorting protein/cytochrome c551/c552